MITGVQPRRVAMVVGAIAAVYVAAVFCARPVPSAVIALLGGPHDDFARYGGLELRWQPPAGLDLAALAARLGDRDVGTELHRDGDLVVIDVPKVSEAAAPALAAQIGQGGLEYREVIESDAARQLVTLGLATDRARELPSVDVDHWRSEDSSLDHIDWYAHASSKAALVAMFAEAMRQGWRPPPHAIVAYAETEARDTGVIEWRSYVVADRAELDGTSVIAATGGVDTYSNRPIVNVELDRRGAQIFGDLTARILGHKLAIMVGGDVRSAPVINTAIRGGRMQITMGAGTAEQQEHERDVLVELLRGGVLPAGGTVIESHYVAARRAEMFEWLGRLALAIAAGLGAGVLASLAIRFTRPERRIVARVEGTGSIWKRVAWTIGGIALAIAGTYITLPGVNGPELSHVISRGTPQAPADLSFVSVFALGIYPLITSFVVVEIAASVVPRWRRLRDGGPDGRRRLGLAVAILAAVIAAVQAYFVATYLESLDRLGMSILAPHSRWLIVATLVGGTACLAWIASIIGQRGIGNGYAVLIVGTWLWRMPWTYLAELAPARLMFIALTIAAIAVIVLAVLRWRVQTPRTIALPLPTSGIAPLQAAGGLWLFVAQAMAVGIVSMEPLVDWIQSIDGRAIPAGVVVAIMAVVWSFVFARPGRRRAELARIDRQPVPLDAWLRATGLTVVAMIAIYAITRSAKACVPEVRSLFEPLVLLVVIATIADVIAEARDRRRGLVPVWPLHDPLLVDVARERLTAAKIPHHIQATRLRSLLWMFGAFVPMMVLVPEPNAAEAERLFRD